MGWTPPPNSGIVDVPEWECHQPLETEGACTMQITTVGIDLAQADSGSVSLTPAQLSMLLEGIDWRMPVRTHEPLLAA